MAHTSELQHKHGNRRHKVAVLVERVDGLYLSVPLPCADFLLLRVTRETIDSLVAADPRFVAKWQSDILQKVG